MSKIACFVGPDRRSKTPNILNLSSKEEKKTTKYSHLESKWNLIVSKSFQLSNQLFINIAVRRWETSTWPLHHWKWKRLKIKEGKVTLSVESSGERSVWALFGSTDGTHTHKKFKCQRAAIPLPPVKRISLNSKAWNPQTFSQFCFSEVDKKKTVVSPWGWLNMVCFELRYTFIFLEHTERTISTHHLFVYQKQLVWWIPPSRACLFLSTSHTALCEETIC